MRVLTPAGCSNGSLAHDEVAAPIERRRDSRHLTVLRVGKLVSGSSEELCLVRNISAGGLKARVYRPKVVGEPFAIQLNNQEAVTGTVQWVRDTDVGIQFEVAVDVDALLGNSTLLEKGLKPRAPRLHLPTLALLRLETEFWGIGICDLSQGGARIEIDIPLSDGQEVVLLLQDFRPLASVVRWTRDGTVGVQFKQPIPYGELTGWLRTIA